MERSASLEAGNSRCSAYGADPDDSQPITETYGMPRINFELTQEGSRIGRKRVARLMWAAGLEGVSRRKGSRTTIRSKEPQVIPDLVKRNFLAMTPNQLWVADMATSRHGRVFSIWLW